MLFLLDDDGGGDGIIPRGLALTGLVLRRARVTNLVVRTRRITNVVVRKPGITLACALVALTWGLW